MNIMKLAGVPLLLALCPIAVHADPITYSFSTDNASFGAPTLFPFLDGLSVTGTFDYDADTPLSSIVPGGPVAGTAVYLFSTADLQGSVGAWSFSDPLGRTLVGDDTFPGPRDFLRLVADPPLGSGGTFGLIGFDIDGFSLVNVRMTWLEGTTDFLSDQNLPGVLPSFQGQLALDFTPTDDPGLLSSVFFDGFTVTQVPEPATFGLLGLGLMGLAFSRRRHCP